MKIRRALVSSALLSLLLASCGDNEFPTEPIRSQRASAEAPMSADQAVSLQVASTARANRDGDGVRPLA
jgi:hypothetical protein